MNKYILLILLILPVISPSQVVSDARLWTGFSVSKKIEKVEFFAGQELRFDENISHIDKVFTELGAEYEVIEGVDLGFAYRFSRDNTYPESGYDMRHRVDFSLGYKNKFQNLKYAIRNKIQTKTAGKGSTNPTFNRTKITLKYDLDKDFEPVVYYEFYYQFNDQQVINRTRTSLGLDYDLNKDNSIKVFYIFENGFNSDELEHNHIWGVSYSLDL